MVFFLVSHMEESVKKKADAGLMITIFLLRENYVFRCQGVKPAPNCNCIRWIYALYMLGRCQGGVKEVSSLGVLVWIHRLSNKHCMTSPSLLNGRLISIELKAFRHWMTDTLSRTRKTWLVQLAVSIIHPIACYVGVQILIFIISIAYWCRVSMWCKGV